MKKHYSEIGERRVALAFPLSALEETEEKLGSLQEVTDKLQETDVKTIFLLADIMIRHAARIEDTPAPMSEVEVAQQIGLKQIIQLSADLLMTLDDWMHMDHNQGQGSRVIDVTLEELDRAEGKKTGLLYRTILAYGLIAGISYTEMQHMAPGLICDCYLTRRDYDDQQHGIKRKFGSNGGED